MFFLTLKIANTIKKLSTTPKTHKISQDNVNPTPTAPPQLHHLHINQSLILAPRNYRNTLAVTEHTSQDHSYPESLVSQLVLYQSKIDDAYVQMVEQPHTTIFRSQNNHFLAHGKRTKIGFLNRYLCYPSNHQRHSSRISLSDLISSPLPTFTNKSPSMDSDDSTQIIF